jgi:hypothetical protein
LVHFVAVHAYRFKIKGATTGFFWGMEEIWAAGYRLRFIKPLRSVRHCKWGTALGHNSKSELCHAGIELQTVYWYRFQKMPNIFQPAGIGQLQRG